MNQHSSRIQSRASFAEEHFTTPSANAHTEGVRPVDFESDRGVWGALNRPITVPTNDEISCRKSEDCSIHSTITILKDNMRNKAAGFALPIRKLRDPTILLKRRSTHPPAKEAIKVRQFLRCRVAVQSVAGNRYHFFRYFVVSDV
jgi:hypothetical protein